MSAETDSGDALRPIFMDVVSVQSQVVYGHVGNNVALPTLRAHGLNVAAVPTVMFSNTPHYPTLHGGALPTDWFGGYLSDLSARGALQRLKAILVGYLGNPEQVAVLSRWINQVLAEYPDVQVIVDPVIGDHDTGIYVADGMVEAVREQLLPLAHGLTPNDFELGHLSGRSADSVEQVVAAARSLLTDRVQWMVVTSAAPGTWGHDDMKLLIVTRHDAQVLSHPRIPVSPKGTGDLFSAKLTARLLEGMPLAEAAASASDHVVAALEATRRAQSLELQLPSNPCITHRE